MMHIQVLLVILVVSLKRKKEGGSSSLMGDKRMRVSSIAIMMCAVQLLQNHYVKKGEKTVWPFFLPLHSYLCKWQWEKQKGPWEERRNSELKSHYADVRMERSIILSVHSSCAAAIVLAIPQLLVSQKIIVFFFFFVRAYTILLLFKKTLLHQQVYDLCSPMFYPLQTSKYRPFFL